MPFIYDVHVHVLTFGGGGGRFDRKVHVSLPDVKARLGILRLYLDTDAELMPSTRLFLLHVSVYVTGSILT